MADSDTPSSSSSDTSGDARVVDNTDENRFELHVNGEVVGFAAYQKAENLLVFTHTEVDPEQEGHGYGSTLIRGALDQVRETGVPVLPTCPFVEAFMRRHEEYQDLDYRAQGSASTD